MCNSNLDAYANYSITPSTTSEVPIVLKFKYHLYQILMLMLKIRNLMITQLIMVILAIAV